MRALVLCGHACLVMSWLFLGTACNRPQQRFLCGTRTAADPDVARRCSEPNEVCLCSINACARIVLPSECPSRYRYSPAPFGPFDAGTTGFCVPAEQVEHSVILPVGSREFCPGQQPPDPPDAASPPSPPDALAEPDGTVPEDLDTGSIP